MARRGKPSAKRKVRDCSYNFTVCQGPSSVAVRQIRAGWPGTSGRVALCHLSLGHRPPHLPQRLFLELANPLARELVLVADLLSVRSAIGLEPETLAKDVRLDGTKPRRSSSISALSLVTTPSDPALRPPRLGSTRTSMKRRRLRPKSVGRGTPAFPPGKSSSSRASRPRFRSPPQSLGRRWPLQLRLQFSLRLPYPMVRVNHVDRKANRPSLVCQRPTDGMANPPACVGREPESPSVVVPFHGLHEANVAFLNQVGKRQPTMVEPPGDGHHQSQVRLHEFVLGLLQGEADCPATVRTYSRKAFGAGGKRYISFKRKPLKESAHPSHLGHSGVEEEPIYVQNAELSGDLGDLLCEMRPGRNRCLLS